MTLVKVVVTLVSGGSDTGESGSGHWWKVVVTLVSGGSDTGESGSYTGESGSDTGEWW